MNGKSINLLSGYLGGTKFGPKMKYVCCIEVV